MNKKKILFCITKSVFGGAQKYVYDLATQIPKDQFEPTVAAGRPNSNMGEPRSERAGGSGPLFSMLADAGVRAIPLATLDRDIHFLKEPLAFLTLYRLFKNEKPDIIHLNSSKVGGLGALAGFLYKLTSRNFSTRIIFTAHGWGYNEDRPHWQKALIIFATWISSLFQDTIITINTVDYNSAKSFISAKKLAFIPNGISITRAPSKIKMRAELIQHSKNPVHPKALLIGTIAELTKNKNITTLISALARVESKTPIHTVIIGEGEDREKIESSIHANRLADRVTLTGFLPDAKQYLSAFDIFVLPSLKEGLPYSIMEAMAEGLPVVATNVGGIPDLITHNSDGVLIPPRNPLALAETLSALANNDVFRKTLGKTAKEKIKNKFTHATMIKRTCEIYLQ